MHTILFLNRGKEALFLLLTFFYSFSTFGQSIDLCGGVSVTTSSNTITVSGLDEPHVIYKLWNTDNGWTLIYECSNNCNTSETITNLEIGTYLVQIQLFDANWQPMQCQISETVVLTSETGSIGDTDNVGNENDGADGNDSDTESITIDENEEDEIDVNCGFSVAYDVDMDINNYSFSVFNIIENQVGFSLRTTLSRDDANSAGYPIQEINLNIDKNGDLLDVVSEGREDGTPYLTSLANMASSTLEIKSHKGDGSVQWTVDLPITTSQGIAVNSSFTSKIFTIDEGHLVAVTYHLGYNDFTSFFILLDANGTEVRRMYNQGVVINIEQIEKTENGYVATVMKQSGTFYLVGFSYDRNVETWSKYMHNYYDGGKKVLVNAHEGGKYIQATHYHTPSLYTKKIDVHTGEVVQTIDITSVMPDSFPNYMRILAGSQVITKDGDLVIGAAYDDLNYDSNDEEGRFFLKVELNSERLEWARLDDNYEYGVSKTIETSSGNFLFTGLDENQSPMSCHIVQLTSTGELGPNCGGEPEEVGETSNYCGGISITTSDNTLRVSGLDEPHVIYKLWNTDNGWTSVYECTSGCNETETTTNLPVGNYLVQIQLFDANWQPTGCVIEEAVLVEGLILRTVLREFEEDVNVYPNPALDLLRVYLGDIKSSGRIELMNLQGTVLKSIVTDRYTNEYTLDLRSIVGGNYMLFISEKGKEPIKKLIVVLEK